MDENYIEQCFELALKGRGLVSPNPLVGCVIVKNGEIISTGYHREYGKAHAEAEALDKLKNAEGATLFCNLEPCCHTNKQTPPCAQRIIAAGIRKVVISNSDPNPNVAGKGIELLKNAGIEVISGVLEQKGYELNRFFFKFITNKIPYVTLKIAQSINNKINTIENEQIWITGKKSKEFVHKLRSEYDAVLIGSNTARIDNPFLNVRECPGRNPYKILLDSRLSTDLNSNLFREEPERLIIFTSEFADRKKIEILQKMQVKVFAVPTDDRDLLEIDKILKILAEEKITSLLVEGGAGIFSSFIQNELFDELIIIQAPRIFSSGLNAFSVGKQIKFHLNKTFILGDDLVTIYRPE